MTLTNFSFHPGLPDGGAATSSLLDPLDGTARVMGERALYLRMLRRFRDDYRDAAAHILAAVDGGEAHLAHRMAHTLKGASGMICAPALYRLAGALEIELRGGAASRPAINAIKAALDELLPAIALMVDADAALPRPTLAPSYTQVSVGRLAEGLAGRLVDRLAALLASGDGAAVDLVEESGAMLATALGEAGFKAVALAVNEFDFEGAMETLMQAAQARRTTAQR